MDIPALHAELDKLRTLKPDWDSYGANPIPEKVIEAAKFVLDMLYGPNAPQPVVGPTPFPGVALIWRLDGKEIDLEITPTNVDGILDIRGEHGNG